METHMLLTTLAIAAGLFGAMAGKMESYKPVKILPPFKPWQNARTAWSGLLASPHIIGGNEAIPHSYPHQVVLFMKGITEKGEKSTSLCGGALLSDSWLITAAHCVDKAVLMGSQHANSDKAKLTIEVGIGVHDISKLQSEDVQLINASQIISHPEWNRTEIFTDIALLRLEKNVRLDGKYARSIRLPKLSQKSESFENSIVTITGWGITDSQSEKRADKLQTADSRVVSNVDCNAQYSFFLKITETNICASAMEGKCTSKGDSGGPMIIKESDGEPTLIGIISLGLNCELGFANVLTRVTAYLDWIHTITKIEPRN